MNFERVGGTSTTSTQTLPIHMQLTYPLKNAILVFRNSHIKIQAVILSRICYDKLLMISSFRQTLRFETAHGVTCKVLFMAVEIRYWYLF